MTKSLTLAVNELFGPTIQGEGKNIGMPCFFLRLAGCPVQCIWCDTKYSWDWKNYNPKEERRIMKVDSVLDVLESKDIIYRHIKALVVSGGEPMVQQQALIPLLRVVRQQWSWWTEIETAGVNMPECSDMVNQFTVSPKLENSKVPRENRLKWDVLKTYAGFGSKTVWKFVVGEPNELAEVNEIVRQAGIMLNKQLVYVMPLGTNSTKLKHTSEKLIQDILHSGYRITPRMHIELWGTRRGV